jgi:hypothetical protein
MCLIISEPQQQRNSTTALTAPLPSGKFASGVVSPEVVGVHAEVFRT